VAKSAKKVAKKKTSAKKPARKVTPAKAAKKTKRPQSAASAAKSRPRPSRVAKSSKTARTAKKSAKAAKKPARQGRPARAGAAPSATATEPRHVPPPVESVPTGGKPRKNRLGLGHRELGHFRDLLLQKRRELVGDMSAMEREALRSTSTTNLSNLPLHMADMGTDNYEQEFTLGLVEKDRQLLREINNALAKLQDGSYGLCEGTGKPISKPRLEAQPWARFSIEHARELEKNPYRR
jgi:DnaK suppressor protein